MSVYLDIFPQGSRQKLRLGARASTSSEAAALNIEVSENGSLISKIAIYTYDGAYTAALEKAINSALIAPSAEAPPTSPATLPSQPGFYWGKWKIAAEGTREADELTPSNTWEVMEVFRNCVDPDDDEYLMVSVPGVEQGQPLDGFVWHLERLMPPNR